MHVKRNWLIKSQETACHLGEKKDSLLGVKIAWFRLLSYRNLLFKIFYSKVEIKQAEKRVFLTFTP